MFKAEISNEQILAEIQRGNEELKLALQATEVKLTLKIEEINHRLIQGTYISIADDLTELQSPEYRILRKHLYDAKQDKNNTYYIRKNRLHVNNRIFTPSDLENLEKESNFNLQTKPHSDPGTPVSEDKTKNSEEFIKEPNVYYHNQQEKEPRNFMSYPELTQV
ncbi:hypothetical protein JTB14_026112 [Gonioctena quinquepunctata]|nr:hypothetical protein JTB14_026112 [Gonioctena quinquepunctata]